GDDEFVVLCEDVADRHQLRLIADAVTNGFGVPLDVRGSLYQVSGCIGMALAEANDLISATDIVRRADIALQHAKRTPGVTVSLFDDALEAHTRRRLELDEELVDAIARGEVSVLYQPVISLT